MRLDNSSVPAVAISPTAPLNNNRIVETNPVAIPAATSIANTSRHHRLTQRAVVELPVRGNQSSTYTSRGKQSRAYSTSGNQVNLFI